MGVINREAHTNVYVGLRAQPKEELLRQIRPRRKGTVSHEKGDGQPSESDASDHSMKEDKY